MKTKHRENLISKMLVPKVLNCQGIQHQNILFQSHSNVTLSNKMFLQDWLFVRSFQDTKVHITRHMLCVCIFYMTTY